MPEPERRRRRPAVSCTLCRKRKIRCNRELPCNNCLRSTSNTCVYNGQRQPPHQHQHQPRLQEPVTESSEPRELVEANYTTPQDTPTTWSTSSDPTASRHSASFGPRSTATSLPDQDEVNALRNRVKELEAKLSQTRSTPPPQLSTTTPQPAIETLSSGITGAFHIEHGGNFFGHTEVSSRSVVHKRRLFGQSHWINSGFIMFRDLVLAIEPYVRDESSKAVSTMGKCKAIAREIKARRTPEWPAPLTTDLPPKGVADQLVECYLRTLETVYRILHVPTFRGEYEELWMSDSKPDPAFLVKLKLVLALGSLTYDERHSLRTAATGWVYQGLTWASDPRLKSRLSIDFMQVHLLLLLAREMVVNNTEAVWIAAGSLLRTAIYMGLHRDPVLFPNYSTYSAEMRRRLWNTILELCLQSTMSSGGPPLISLQDFDTQPPGNFDDEELTAEDPVPKPEREFTQMTVARALRKTLPLRLAVTKYLNDVNSRTRYEDALRLDKELRASYKDFCKALQSCDRSRSGSSGTLSPFAFRVADFIMHRYISSLHIPFFDHALRDSSFAYSRKTAVDSMLKLWCSAYPSTSIATSRSQDEDGAILARFIKCGTGFFRTVNLHAIVTVALELREHLRENDGFGPTLLRRDLLSVLDDGGIWLTECIKAGETNPKGYLFYALMRAQIEWLIQGAVEDKLAGMLAKAAEEASETCLRLLEDLAAEGQPEGFLEELDHSSWTTPAELLSDFELMISDRLFNGTSTEQMDWVLNDYTPPLSR